MARATAEDLITKGHARSIMRGKAIQLTMHPDQLRDQSCKMGINVIEQAHLDNNRHAHSLIAGWYFNSRGIGPNGKDYIHVKEETLTALGTLYAIAEGSYKPPVEIAGPTA